MEDKSGFEYRIFLGNLYFATYHADVMLVTLLLFHPSLAHVLQYHFYCIAKYFQVT